MANYRIFETENFQDNLKQIRLAGSKSIQKKLESYVYPQLREEPHFGLNIKKLRDFTPETWRYRIGDWRFFYQIDEEEHIVYMVAAHHRKEAY
ncbi:MAG: type II toxin-antitoxin system mRNA interferase toxin, RelE/StbE family [Actinomycetota bacterium]|nr:type II toxin-antitoxin system mRNA interferase toxin, RelE/StbE family [Actinomycetota bacterium]MDI6822730.1 type II toxin-antitoxin system mRNA interferase toxin, RelE/StbE family [Actinomycetota bacterium]